MSTKQEYLSGGLNNLMLSDRKGEQNPQGEQALRVQGVERRLVGWNAGFYPVFIDATGNEVWNDITLPLYLAVS